MRRFTLGMLTIAAVAGASSAGPTVAVEPRFVFWGTADGNTEFAIDSRPARARVTERVPDFRGFYYNRADPWRGTWWDTSNPWGFGYGRLYVRWYTYEGGLLGRVEVDERIRRALVAEDPRQDPPLIAIRQSRYLEAASLLIDRASARLAAEDPAGPKNRRALRLASVAMAMGGWREPAARICRIAHAEDPTLWGEPIDGIGLFGRARIRLAMDRARRFAQERESAAAWTLAACVAQAAGEHGLCRRWMDNARALDW